MGEGGRCFDLLVFIMFEQPDTKLRPNCICRTSCVLSLYHYVYVLYREQMLK